MFNVEEYIVPTDDKEIIKLEVTVCETCESYYFPHKEICANCLNEQLSKVEVGPYGEIFSFTTVRVDTQLFKAPYTIGYIDLDHKVRLLAQIQVDNTEQLQAGKKVECVKTNFNTADGAIFKGFSFRVVEEEK